MRPHSPSVGMGAGLLVDAPPMVILDPKNSVELEIGSDESADPSGQIILGENIPAWVYVCIIVKFCVGVKGIDAEPSPGSNSGCPVWDGTHESKKEIVKVTGWLTRGCQVK